MGLHREWGGLVGGIRAKLRVFSIAVRHAVDVARPVQDADNVNASAVGAVENQVSLETFDATNPQSRQAWVGGIPPLADRGHVGDLLEG